MVHVRVFERQEVVPNLLSDIFFSIGLDLEPEKSQGPEESDEFQS
jgi:hypothetical protein